MKHLKSTSSDLRRLFERAISVREVAQPLVSFDTDRDPEEANASDFSDCLQICDKATIVLRDSELSALANSPSQSAGQRFFNALESLRNDLAHANDILKGRWPELAELVKEGETLLVRLEPYRPTKPPYSVAAK